MFAFLPLSSVALTPARPIRSIARAAPNSSGAPRYAAHPSADVRPAPRERSDFADNRPGAARPGSMGGGFIEFLFSGAHRRIAARRNQRPWEDMAAAAANAPVLYARRESLSHSSRAAHRSAILEAVVDYPTHEKPGTVVIDTPNRFLYLVADDGKAIRYGIGVGRPGFEWAGVKTITRRKNGRIGVRRRKCSLRRRPAGVYGGRPGKPARRARDVSRLFALSHPRLERAAHDRHAVSSGCIRMSNEDVIDLYEKVKVGTKVIVI